MNDLSDSSRDDTALTTEVPEELIRAGAKGRLTVLVGAGVSCGSGLPGWEGLVDELFARAESMDLSESERGDLEEAKALRVGARDLLLEGTLLAEILEETWVHQTVAEVLLEKKAEPSPAHCVLARLAGRARFLTTNYDQLLEDAIEQGTGQRPSVITPHDVADLANRELHLQAVFKLHGDLNRPETIVITERDYDRLQHVTPRAWRKRLQAIAQDGELLLVGYGYGDPDIQYELKDLAAAYEGFLPNAFWLSLGNFLNRTRAKTHDLRLIELEDYAEVVPWLERLVEAIEQRLAETPQARQVRTLVGGVSKFLDSALQGAIELFDQGEYDSAYEKLDELEQEVGRLLVEAQPEDAEAEHLRADQARLRLNKAGCRLNQQRFDEARELARRVEPKELLPKPAALGVLAQALAQVGEADRARAALDLLPPGWETEDHTKEAVNTAKDLIAIAGGEVPEAPTAPWIAVQAARPLYDRGRLRDASQKVLTAIGDASATGEKERRDSLMTASALSMLAACLERSVRENPPAEQPIPEDERKAVIDAIEELLERLSQSSDLPEPTQRAVRESRMSYFRLTRDEERFGIEVRRTNEMDDSVEMLTPEVERAKRLMEEGQLDEALAALEDRRHPWMSVVWKSGLLGQFGENERALELLSRTAERYPGRYDLEYEIASHLRSLERLAEALPHAERAFQSLPGRGARLLLAECYLGSTDDTGGQHRIEKARDLLEPLAKTRWPTALSALAQARAASTRGGARASDAWRRYLEISELSGNRRALVLTHLSRALYHEGDRAGAAEQAEAAFDAGKDTLDPQMLWVCGHMMLSESPAPSDQRVRRVKEIARTLRRRFPGDQAAEQAYFALYLNLGTPSDLEPADYDGLVGAGVLRAVPMDEAVELIQQKQNQASTVWQLYRMGRLTSEGLSRLAQTPLARLVVGLLRSNPAENQFLSAPVNSTVDLPTLKLDGARLLLGELELLILMKLDLLERARTSLGAQGKLLIFRDVLECMAKNAAELSLASPEARFDSAQALLELLQTRTDKVRTIASSDERIGQDLLQILDDERSVDARRWIPTASVLSWLSDRGVVAQDLIKRHLDVLPPGEPIEELPRRLVVSWPALTHLQDLGGLETVIDDVEELFVTEADWSFMQTKIQEARLEVDTANLTRELYDWVNQVRARGGVEVVDRPEVSHELPPPRNPENEPIKEIIAESLSWHMALEAHPEALMVTGDYLVSEVFSGGTPLDIFTTLKWTEESYRAMSTRVRALSDRRTGLSHLVRHLVQPGEEEKLLELARLGFVLALDAKIVLQHIRRYAPLDRAQETTKPQKELYHVQRDQSAVRQRSSSEFSLGRRTNDLLSRAEWIARQPSHPGAVVAGLHIAGLYAKIIWSCWEDGKRWNDAERANITGALLARTESIEQAGASGILEHLFYMVGASTVDGFRSAFVPEDNGVTYTLSHDSEPARLWTTITDWALVYRRRRAALDRALLHLYRTLDELFETEQRVEPVLAALMLPIFARMNEPRWYAESVIMALQTLSANWQLKPLDGLGIDFQIDGKDKSSTTLEELAYNAARYFEEDNAEGLVIRNTRWQVVHPIEDDHTATIEISPEAVILRMNPDKLKQAAGFYSNVVGVLDGRLFELLERLQGTPEDRHLRRELAWAGVSAPFRLVRQDPPWIAQWGQLGTSAVGICPRTLDDLRQLLSQPHPSLLGDQAIEMPATLQEKLVSKDGLWSERPYARSLLSMAIEVPGSLPAFMVSFRIAVDEKEYQGHVRTALRVLKRSAEQPAARLESEMVFLRVAAARRPFVELESGTTDLRELLPELFESVVREELRPESQQEAQGSRSAIRESEPEKAGERTSLRTAEPALLRLCASVVRNLARSEPTAHETELLWLSWRLFQWLELQLRALAPLDREAGLRDLTALAPPPLPSEQASADVLDPRRFDPAELPHRLMAVIHALSLAEMALFVLDGEKNEPERKEDEAHRPEETSFTVASPALEKLLIRVTSRPLSRTERDLLIRGRQPGSALGWDAPGTVQELALAALLEMNSARLFDLDKEQRQRWFFRLPGVEGQEVRLHPQTVTELLKAVSSHGERLAAEERNQLADILPDIATNLPKLADICLLAMTGLLRAGDRGVEPEIRRMLERDPLRSGFVVLLGFYLAALSFVAPEEIEEVFLHFVERAQDEGADVAGLAGALTRAMFAGRRESVPHVAEVLRRIAVRPPFDEDVRVKEMLGLLGLAEE